MVMRVRGAGCDASDFLLLSLDKGCAVCSHVHKGSK